MLLLRLGLGLGLVMQVLVLRDVPLREATQAPVGASGPELRTLAGSSASSGLT